MKTQFIAILIFSATVALGQETNQSPDAEWSKLPAEEKRRVLKLHHALTQLPPEQRKFIHDRIERFLNMSPEEKQRLKENAERWKNMTPEQREQARQKFRDHRRQLEEKWRQEHPGEEPPAFLRHHRPPDQSPKPNQEENP